MGLYTFLYENLLYRLYFIRIQPARIVTARLSRYTAHTAYTAIQPYTPYIIQRYTASLSAGHHLMLVLCGRLTFQPACVYRGLNIKD